MDIYHLLWEQTELSPPPSQTIKSKKWVAVLRFAERVILVAAAASASLGLFIYALESDDRDRERRIREARHIADCFQLKRDINALHGDNYYYNSPAEKPDYAALTYDEYQVLIDNENMRRRELLEKHFGVFLSNCGVIGDAYKDITVRKMIGISVPL